MKECMEGGWLKRTGTAMRTLWTLSECNGSANADIRVGSISVQLFIFSINTIPNG